MQSSTPKVLLPSVWPLPVSLAATSGISFDFSSSAYLDVSVQRVSPPMTILFTIGWQSIALPCFHIRISADLCLFAAPRSFSQLITSFIGSWCQGILHVLFFAWPRHSSPLRSFAYANFTLSGGCSSSQKISSPTPFFGSPTHLIPISAGFRLSVPCKVKRSLVLLSDSQLCE